MNSIYECIFALIIVFGFNLMNAVDAGYHIDLQPHRTLELAFRKASNLKHSSIEALRRELFNDVIAPNLLNRNTINQNSDYVKCDDDCYRVYKMWQNVPNIWNQTGDFRWNIENNTVIKLQDWHQIRVYGNGEILMYFPESYWTKPENAIKGVIDFKYVPKFLSGFYFCSSLDGAPDLKFDLSNLYNVESAECLEVMPQFYILSMQYHAMGGTLNWTQLFQKFPNLKVIDLKSNKFIGNINDFIQHGHDSLESLTLTFNGFSGNVLPKDWISLFTKYPKLKDIALQHNNLRGIFDLNVIFDDIFCKKIKNFEIVGEKMKVELIGNDWDTFNGNVQRNMHCLNGKFDLGYNGSIAPAVRENLKQMFHAVGFKCVELWSGAQCRCFRPGDRVGYEYEEKEEEDEEGEGEEREEKEGEDEENEENEEKEETEEEDEKSEEEEVEPDWHF